MHKYPTTSTFKRGDSFVLACVYKENDIATSVTGVTIRSQLRYSLGEKVCDLVATPHANQVLNPGVFSLAPTDQNVTKTWKAPNTLYCDIEFLKNGNVYSTSTFQVPLEKDITI